MDIKNLLTFKKKKSSSSRESYYAPTFHWQLSLGVAFAIILLGAALGVVLYILVNRPVGGSLSSGAATNKSEEQKVEDTLLYFRTKAETFSNLKETKPRYVDPLAPVAR